VSKIESHLIGSLATGLLGRMANNKLEMMRIGLYYGSYALVALATGFLFLGAGSLTFDTNNESGA